MQTFQVWFFKVQFKFNTRRAIWREKDCCIYSIYPTTGKSTLEFLTCGLDMIGLVDKSQLSARWMNNKCRSEILHHLLVSTNWEWPPAQCSGTSSTWLALNMSEGWSKCFASSNFLLSPLFCQVELMKKELQRDSFQLLQSWLNVARYLPLPVRAGGRCDRYSSHTLLSIFEGVAVQLCQWYDNWVKSLLP